MPANPAADAGQSRLTGGFTGKSQCPQTGDFSLFLLILGQVSKLQERCQGWSVEMRPLPAPPHREGGGQVGAAGVWACPLALAAPTLAGMIRSIQLPFDCLYTYVVFLSPLPPRPQGTSASPVPDRAAGGGGDFMRPCSCLSHTHTHTHTQDREGASRRRADPSFSLGSPCAFP